MSTQHTYKVTKKDLPKSEVELEAEIPWEHVEKHRADAVKTLSKNVSIKGFRKGAVPEHILVKEIGESGILYEMAERALSHAYPQILMQEKIATIGRPNVTITKLAKGNPLAFKAVSAVIPEVKLPEYKKIAKEVNNKQEEVKLEKKEVDEAVEHIREQWAKSEKLEAMKKESDKVNPADVKVEKDELPELNDEFVKKLGPFESVEDFRTKLEENMKREKELKTQEKRRIELLEGIVEKTEVELPDVVVESELAKMVGQFEEDVKRAGFELEQYLKEAGKSLDELKSEWRADAEKRAKTQLTLNKIAVEEDITPDEKVLEEEVEKVMKQYKNADRERAHVWMHTILTNEKVIEFLENQ